jgi:uncharacterized membrane protein
MIRPALRVVAAVAGLLVLIAGLGWPLRVAGILLMLPLFASWRAPRAEELENLSEWVARLRTAMVVCYGTALWLFIATARMTRAPYESVRSAAALGSAFWTVGFVAMVFTAYYASRRAALLRDRITER